MTGFTRLAGLDHVPEALKGAMVAIGNFDGCHRGHQHVFTALRARAREQGVPAIVLTFEPHPRTVFAPDNPVFRLSPAPVKAAIMEAMGLDGVVVVPFDKAFAGIEAERFVDDILIGALGIRK